MCLVNRAVYIQHLRNDGLWTITARITEPGLSSFANLGYAVAIDRAGRRILVGAPGNSSSKGSGTSARHPEQTVVGLIRNKT